jgi:hypothetical protein
MMMPSTPHWRQTIAGKRHADAIRVLHLRISQELGASCPGGIDLRSSATQRDHVGGLRRCAIVLRREVRRRLRIAGKPVTGELAIIMRKHLPEVAQVKRFTAERTALEMIAPPVGKRELPRASAPELHAGSPSLSVAVGHSGSNDGGSIRLRSNVGQERRS